MRTRFLLPIALLALASCNDPVGPDATLGMYVLHSVAGEPLPRVAWATEQDGTLTLLADTIWLDGRGGAKRRTVLHRTASQFVPEATYGDVRDLDYRVDGGRFEIGFFGPCMDTPSVCIANEVGTIGSDRIELQLIWSAPNATGVYMRTGVED